MTQSDSEHIRHRPPTSLEFPRPLVIACPQLRSGVNLSRIVRLAGCCGVTRMVVCGNTKVDSKVARDAAEYVRLERRRSLEPQLVRLRSEGYRLVGLEQTTGSVNLHHYRYHKNTVLCLGHERDGMDQATIGLMDDLIEIPVYGMPASYNVVTATTMAVYEYCRQFPNG